MKDIFIDNNIVNKFANPPADNYKELIKWLMLYNDDENEDAYLVVSNRLLGEYSRSASNCSKPTSIPVIIDKLTREDRLIKFKNLDIIDFKRSHFTKTIKRQLRSNKEDHNHISIVLMSDRKYALTMDTKLAYDLSNFPRFTVTVADNPGDIDYK